MNLKVLTWNTNSDPTMKERVRRRKEIHSFLKNHGEDCHLIALQELSSFKAGPVSFLLYIIIKHFPAISPTLLQILDYFMMLEGLILPLVTVNNSRETEIFLKETGFHYTQASRSPRYYMNSGLLIASKFPIEESESIAFPSDAIHSPGGLSVTIKIEDTQVQFITCHLIPTLPETTVPYKICNYLNRKLKKNPQMIREKSLTCIQKYILKGNVIIAGDFNIDSAWNEEYETMLRMLSSKDINTAKNATFHDSGIDECIDYILIPKNASVIDLEIIDTNRISDHYPIFATIQLNIQI